MPDFAVSTAFTPIDKVSAAFKNMGRNATNFGNKTSGAFKKANKSGSIFGGTLKAILSAGIISRGIGLLQQGISATVRDFIAFDQAIVSSSAKFKGLNLQTDAGRETLEKLKATAKDVGATTQFSAAQAAEGINFLAMAGFNADQSMASLKGVVDLATVANIDLGRSTDIASDALGAFGLMTEDSTQLQKNFTRLNDVMALTMNRTNTGIEDMFESLKKGAPTFTAAGQSVESFNALVGVLASSGVKGAEAGTQLRNVMLRLASPTKEAQKQLKNLGVVTQDSQGNFRDIVDILADVEKGTSKMGNVQKSAALSTIFGARAVTGMNILLANGSKNLRDFREDLINSGGAAAKAAAIMRQSLGNRLAILGSTAKDLGFKFLVAFEKQGGRGIDRLTQSIKKINVEPLITVLKVLFRVLKFLFKTIRANLPLITSLTASFLAFKIIMGGIALVSTIKNFLFLNKAIKVASISQGIFNAIMAANPIGLIVLGIAAVIGIITFLVIKFDIITVVMTKIKSIWKSVVNAFKSGSLIEKIKSIGLTILNFLLAPIRGFLRLLAKIPGMSNFANNALDKIKINTGEESVNRQSPNSEEVKAQQSTLTGNINVNAPAGTTVDSKSTGPNKVNMKLAGAAP